MLKEVAIYIRTEWHEFLRVGGYGAVIECDGKTHEILGGTGDNRISPYRLSLRATVAALQALPEACEVTLHSNSEYVANGIKGWALKWRENNWHRSDGKKVENADLWEEVLDLMETHGIGCVLIENHNGFEYGNEYHERAYELAVKAVRRGITGGYTIKIML
jgi:ribonuclease HI